MLISLCGKSCAGKTTIAHELINIYGGDGIQIDIDRIGHKVLTIKEVKEQLVNAFGNITTNGEIDRKKLGPIVFSSPKQMERLTAITWKYMEQEIDKTIEENKDKIIVLDWALLPKTKYFGESEFRVLLDVDYETRKKRALMRDHISEEQFELREQASMQYDKTDFNFVLNETNYKDLKEMGKKL